MENSKREEINYIVEREFLSKITLTELVNNIIQSHVKNDIRGEGV